MDQNTADILRQHQYRGGSQPTVLYEITYAKLAVLFNVSVHTIKKWKYNNLLNPYSLEDIIDKYNNRYKLDRRRKQTATHEQQGEEYARHHQDKGCASQ